MHLSHWDLAGELSAGRPPIRTVTLESMSNEHEEGDQFVVREVDVRDETCKYEFGPSDIECGPAGPAPPGGVDGDNMSEDVKANLLSLQQNSYEQNNAVVIIYHAVNRTIFVQQNDVIMSVGEDLQDAYQKAIASHAAETD